MACLLFLVFYHYTFLRTLGAYLKSQSSEAPNPPWKKIGHKMSFDKELGAF